jgi:hypothetical protein
MKTQSSINVAEASLPAGMQVRRTVAGILGKPLLIGAAAQPLLHAVAHPLEQTLRRRADVRVRVRNRERTFPTLSKRACLQLLSYPGLHEWLTARLGCTALPAIPSLQVRNWAAASDQLSALRAAAP